MKLTQTITISPDAVFRQLDGEAVLLDLRNGHYFGLDEVGTRIWQLLAELDNAGAVYEKLLAEYEVDEAQLHQDLTELIAALAEAGLITVAER